MGRGNRATATISSLQADLQQARDKLPVRSTLIPSILQLGALEKDSLASSLKAKEITLEVLEQERNSLKRDLRQIGFPAPPKDNDRREIENWLTKYFLKNCNKPLQRRSLPMILETTARWRAKKAIIEEFIQVTGNEKFWMEALESVDQQYAISFLLRQSLREAPEHEKESERRAYFAKRLAKKESLRRRYFHNLLPSYR
jgi:hypothetical protein